MSFWQILVVIAIIIIPLILSIWMTLWTVEKRGRGPKPVYKPNPEVQPDQQAESSDQPSS